MSAASRPCAEPVSARFLVRLVALRTVRDVYVLVAIGVLHGSAWLDRRRLL